MYIDNRRVSVEIIQIDQIILQIESNVLLHFLTIQQQFYNNNIFSLLTSRYLIVLYNQLVRSFAIILHESALEKLT